MNWKEEDGELRKKPILCCFSNAVVVTSSTHNFHLQGLMVPFCTQTGHDLKRVNQVLNYLVVKGGILLFNLNNDVDNAVYTRFFFFLVAL